MIVPPIGGVASTFPMLKGGATSHKANVMGEETTKTSLVRGHHMYKTVWTLHI